MAEVRVIRPDLLTEPPAEFVRQLRGLAFAEIGRRGKNVVLLFSADTVVVVNLGMTGRVLFRGAGDDTAPPATHPGVLFNLVGGGLAVYDDARRFGRLRRFSLREWRLWSRTLGPEPLSRSFTARRLAADLGTSVSPVRSWLLDQRRVAGVGNIYANEALYRAGVHPATPARAVPAARVGPLHRAIRSVLKAAIQARGTTLRDYRDATGQQGSFRPLLGVYGREGEPCAKCDATIARTVISNRSAFYCPECQSAPP